MGYLRDVYENVAWIERQRLAAMTPEERAADRRDRRRAALRDAAVGVPIVTAILSVTALPWVLGAWAVVGWIADRFRG